MNISNLAKNIIDLMQKCKITTVELSRKTGVSEITINKIRAGQNNNPTIATLSALANFFDTTINDLLTEDRGHLLVLDENNTVIDKVHINTTSGTQFAIKILHNNYPPFKYGTILLINQNLYPDNSDYIAVNIENKITICSTVIEFDTILGKSLSATNTVFKIKSENILGVVTGALWIKK